jgi:hypothetical protein
MMKTEYTILEAPLDSFNWFEGEITKFLNDGWDLAGGPFVGEDAVFQALIKRPLFDSNLGEVFYKEAVAGERRTKLYRS